MQTGLKYRDHHRMSIADELSTLHPPNIFVTQDKNLIWNQINYTEMILST